MVANQYGFAFGAYELGNIASFHPEHVGQRHMLTLRISTPRGASTNSFPFVTAEIEYEIASLQDKASRYDQRRVVELRPVRIVSAPPELVRDGLALIRAAEIDDRLAAIMARPLLVEATLRDADGRVVETVIRSTEGDA